MKQIKPNIERPPSVTHLWLNGLGVVGFFLSIWALRAWFPDSSQVMRAAIVMLATILPILLVEIFYYRVQRNPAAKLKAPSKINVERLAIKFGGLMLTYLILAFFYWLFPEYYGGFFQRYFQFIFWLAPFAFAFSAIYIVVVDGRMEAPEDAYYHMGLLLIGRYRLVRKQLILEHFRGWIVKGFFLPLMFVFMLDDVNFLVNYQFSSMQSFLNAYDFLYTTIFSVDVIFAVLGYMMTFRLLDTHIRSVEPTWIGWISALICYPPFWTQVFGHNYLIYNDDFYWGHWFTWESAPMLQLLWGGAIIVLISIYSLATVCMGYRFSNLTYRGLVANGPYRFTKHPAYITKNLSWWMISIPFFPSSDWETTLRFSLMLMGINIVYFIRARTEENHLSNYPEYVEYANWMNEHGLLRFIGNAIPFLRYDEARAKRSGSIVWWKKA